MDKTDRKQVEELIANGVDQGIWKVILFTMGVWIALLLLDYSLFRVFQLGADSTDSETARSGMVIKTDNKTGCEYLATRDGGLTPRVDYQGYQLGCKK